MKRDVLWPLRSNDLSYCSLFLLRYLKSKMYVDRSPVIFRIKDTIWRIISQVPIWMLDVMNSVTHRIQEEIFWTVALFGASISLLCLNEKKRHVLSIQKKSMKNILLAKYSMDLKHWTTNWVSICLAIQFLIVYVNFAYVSEIY